MRVNLTVLLFSACASAYGGSCSSLNPPLRWTIHPMFDVITSNAVQGDGLGDYVDGQSNVTARLNECSGTHDATLQLGKARSISVAFRPLATTSATPSYAATGQTISGSWFVNVRNLLFVPEPYDRTQEYDFTTRITMTLPSGTGGLRMWNPNSDAVTTAPDPQTNTPWPNSLVNVHHCPDRNLAQMPPSALCAGAGPAETWLVSPAAGPTAPGVSQTGTPIVFVASFNLTQKNARVDGGEYSVPFSFSISLVQ